MDIRTVLADSVLSTKVLLARFLPGFDDTNHTRQAPGLPNHVAWNLGHLALTMHRAAMKIDAKPLPTDVFIEGSDRGEGGERGRFGTESVGFNSTPTADPARYPSLARCVAIFDGACDRLAGAVRNAPDDTLAALHAWGPMQIPAWMMVQRMLFHNGTHTGQIIDLRRALNMPRVLG